MAFDAGEIKGRLTIDKTQWDKSAKSVKKSQQRMAVQTKKVGTSFAKMWKQVAIGAGVTTLISRGIRMMSREITDVFRKGREFEKEWANVTTMLSISRGETAKMRDELRRLSPTLGDTADLARGMYQVLSASIEPAKAIKFLGVAAKAAKAGITDTRTAVDAITTVINAYGMAAEDATEVSDIMFSTVKRGKLTFAEMATSLGTIVPVASKVGLTFNEVAAAMSTLTRQGIDARTATMQLRQVIMSILSPTDDAIALAESLGFEWSIDALKADGLAKILGELEEKTGGNNELLKMFVPNVRALTAVMGLAGTAAEGLADDLEGTKKAAGLSDEAFGKQMETMDFWLEAAEVTADKWKIAFYEGLINPMREAIKSSKDFDEKVTKASNETADTISLNMGAIHEEISFLVKVYKAVEKAAFGWKGEVSLAEAVTLNYAAATHKLNLALERLRITEAGKTLADVTAKTKETTEGMKEAKEEVYEFATSFEDVWARVQAVELDILWRKFGKMVENTEMAEDSFKSMGDEIEITALELVESIGWVESAMHDLGPATKEYPLGLADAAVEAGAILSSMGRHSKALAYAGAVINTAVGATMALRNYPPPLSFAMAALQAAAGLSEIAAISAQDIPSAAEGGFMPKPALIEAGHGPSGEVILPLDKAPGMAQRIIIQNSIMIGEHVFYSESVKSINEAGRLGDLIIPNKVVV